MDGGGRRESQEENAEEHQQGPMNLEGPQWPNSGSNSSNSINNQQQPAATWPPGPTRAPWTPRGRMRKRRRSKLRQRRTGGKQRREGGL